MKIRLIGIEDTGEAVVAACTARFADLGIATLLDRTKTIIKLTTRPFLDTYTEAYSYLEKLKFLPTHELRRRLRSYLTYLFFGGPASEINARWSNTGLSGNHEFLEIFLKAPFTDDHKKALTSILLHGVPAGTAPPKAPDRPTYGKQAHANYMETGKELFGENWLIVPDLPLASPPDFKCPKDRTIGRLLMAKMLRSSERMRQLTVGLGEVKNDVDVVVVAFSAGDAFGGCGADELACAIREVLQELDRDRIVALLGVGIYGSVSSSANGYNASRYLRVDRALNGFDGVIFRRNDFASILGVADLLTAIAMSSDRRVVQIDNPDSNQIQRDFGRSLVAAGFARSHLHGNAPTEDGILLPLFQQALDDLIGNHAEKALPVPLSIIEGEVAKLSRGATALSPAQGAPDAAGEPDAGPPDGAAEEGADEEDEPVPPFVPPDWLDGMNEGGYKPGKLEKHTARKVIVYIGYDDSVTADVITELRRKLLDVFPRAGTAIYKYHVARVRDWLTPGVAPPLLAERAYKHAAGLLPATNGALPPAGARLAPPAAADDLIQPHIGVFVVDALETVSLSHVFNHFLRSARCRDPITRQVIADEDHAEQALGLLRLLFARSVLSIPDSDLDDRWVALRTPDGGLQTCTTDPVLGLVNDDLREEHGEAVRRHLAGEVLPTDLETEGQTFSRVLNTSSAQLVRKAELHALQPNDFAEILVGLHWLANERLDTRMVVAPLSAFFTPGT